LISKCWRRCWRGRRLVVIEIDLRSLARALFRLEVRVVANKTRKAGDQVVREQRNVRVVGLHGIVIPPPLNSNAVFCARQLILQAHEIFVGLQLRIIFHDREQTPDCAVQLSVGGNLFLRTTRREQRRAGFGDVAKHRLLLLRVSFHGLDQVRDQIGAPLQHNVDLRPCAFYRFILCYERVLHADVLTEDHESEHQQYDNDNNPFTHNRLLKT